MIFPLTDEEKKDNVRFRLLAVVTEFGGQRIVAGPGMELMVSRLVEQVEGLARGGFLPQPTEETREC